VHKAKLDGERVCVKVLRAYQQDTGSAAKKVLSFRRFRKSPLNYPGRQVFYREVVVWKRLQHPNIVPFLGVPSQVPPFEIVCEWMENDRITEFVREHPEVDRVGLVSKSISAVPVRLDSQAPSFAAVGCGGRPPLPPLVQHNTWRFEGRKLLNPSFVTYPKSDINLNDSKANILVDGSRRARLTDFGLASIMLGEKSIVSAQDPSVTTAVTWSAPEILEGGPVSKEGDIFTFAMVTVEVHPGGAPRRSSSLPTLPVLEQTFTGGPAFALNFHAAILEILKGKRPGRPATLLHDGLWGITKRCWSKEPKERPTTSQLLEFFRKS